MKRNDAMMEFKMAPRTNLRNPEATYRELVDMYIFTDNIITESLFINQR